MFVLTLTAKENVLTMLSFDLNVFHLDLVSPFPYPNCGYKLKRFLNSDKKNL